MYDLLLKGGTVLDPSTGLDGIHDIAVQGGVIARIAADIPRAEAARTLEVADKTVTPGLIDLHAHVFDGFNRTGVHPDLAGVYAGVTTIVDAGSSGSATFGGFPRHVIPNCQTEVIPFLHICQTGLATMPDIIAESSINLDDTLRVADLDLELAFVVGQLGGVDPGFALATDVHKDALRGDVEDPALHSLADL